jgi:hypothetical protein
VAATRRMPLALLSLVLVLVVLAALATVLASPGAADEHEVWVLDQGTDRIHVYDADHDEVATIDVSPQALREIDPDFDPEAGATVPHMVDFDSQGRYAFVAATAGGATLVIDAVEREPVAVLDTGAGSHMAAVTPDDATVWVAAIGAEQLVEVPLDLDVDEPEFATARTIDVGDLLADSDYDFPSASPVCHQYTRDGAEAWVTLGPGMHDGGLIAVDLEAGELANAWDPGEVRANCGIYISDDGERAIANWSGTFGDDADEVEGEFYSFDVDTYELRDTASSDGIDAHGVRLTPDGQHFWQVNRGTDNGQVIDAETFEVVADIPDAGASPDILDFSPDGASAYVTQRGPNPLSGDPHVATGDDPGVAVLDTETREVVEVLRQPEVTDDEGQIRNDIHGIAVRPAAGGRETVAAAPATVASTTGGVTFGCHLA